MKTHRSMALKRLLLGTAILPLIAGCADEERAGGHRVGQSGSEFSPPVEGEGGGMNSGEPKPCPCEHLAGSLPLLGKVLAWSSSVLTLEVTAIGTDTPPANAPVAGDILHGIYSGWLPCLQGSYVPNPGDSVLGYFFVKKDIRPLCCAALACDESCAHQEAAVSENQCLIDCQQSANANCHEQFKGLEISGEFTLSPATEGGFVLGKSDEDIVFVNTEQLQLVFEGGASCLKAFGEVQSQLKDTPNEYANNDVWMQSCPPRMTAPFE